jgi:S1-C subfamily serine protease
VIVRIGSDEIESAPDVFAALRDLSPREETELSLVRDGRQMSLSVVLGERQGR